MNALQDSQNIDYAVNKSRFLSSKCRNWNNTNMKIYLTKYESSWTQILRCRHISKLVSTNNCCCCCVVWICGIGSSRWIDDWIIMISNMVVRKMLWRAGFDCWLVECCSPLYFVLPELSLLPYLMKYSSSLLELLSFQYTGVYDRRVQQKPEDLLSSILCFAWVVTFALPYKIQQ